MAQIIPGAVRAPTFGSAPANTTSGAPANTTTENTAVLAAHAANTTAAGSPDPGDPAGEEVVPPWYGGTPCPHEIESNCAK